MSAEDWSNAPAVTLYVFSGPHLGARLELGEGTWLLGADDSCDIILNELAPRHAVLEIASRPDAENGVTLSPLDGSVRLRGEKETAPPGPGEQVPRLSPKAGRAWYLGRTCFAWNLPDAEQEVILPEAEDLPAPASPEGAVEGAGGKEGAPAGNEVAAPEQPAAPESDNILSASSSPVAAAPVEMPLPPVKKKKNGLRTRVALLFVVAVILAGMSVALTPPAPKPEQYPAIVQQYLADAGISGLTVRSRAPGVEVRGTVENDAAMLRLRDMARALHFPVYLEVGVREDVLRAVRSSLGIRGFHPAVSIDEKDGEFRLNVSAYMKDALLEEAAFSALESEVRGLPAGERRVVHEKELAPVLDEALNAAGLSSVRVIYLPGRVDFVGDFRPEDARTLLRIRREAGERFGVPLYGESSVMSASAGMPGAQASGMPGAAAAPSAPAPSGARLAAEKDAEGEVDPLGGLRVTGVTMSPMRFVTTADGRRLFEGAVLPGGCTLESIGTKVLMLRRGDRIFTYRLRGSQ